MSLGKGLKRLSELAAVGSVKRLAFRTFWAGSSEESLSAEGLSSMKLTQHSLSSLKCTWLGAMSLWTEAESDSATSGTVLLWCRFLLPFGSFKRKVGMRGHSWGGVGATESIFSAEVPASWKYSCRLELASDLPSEDVSREWSPST